MKSLITVDTALFNKQLQSKCEFIGQILIQLELYNNAQTDGNSFNRNTGCGWIDVHILDDTPTLTKLWHENGNTRDKHMHSAELYDVTDILFSSVVQLTQLRLTENALKI